MHGVKAALAVSLAMTAGSPAFAQKSQDTLRLAINDPFPSLLRYHYTVDESNNFSSRIFGHLVAVDEHAHKIIPQLATAWRQVDPVTLDFDLRDDTLFHNGNKFDADDVVATLRYASDPAAAILNRERYAWIKSVEKLGPYKVRVVSTSPNAMALGLLAYVTEIFDQETFDALANKNDYGRQTPVGTGPYKVTDFTNQGLTVERYDGYKGDPAYSRAPIKRIRAIPLPDPQTQQAQLMTGGVDILRNVQPDLAKSLQANPNLEMTVIPSGYLIVFGMDAAGRAGNKALMDARVRKALWMAIDRDKLIAHIVPGGDSGAAEKLAGLCFESNIACQIGTPPAIYDPAAAKKLLTEAGYPNGFDLDYSVFAPIRPIAEAIAGDLIKIGVRVKVTPLTFGVYVKNRGDGAFQAFSVFYPTATHPDVGTTLNVFFGDNRDYANDPVIQQAMTQGLTELDPQKRAAIYQTALDRNNEMNYVMAVSSLPTVYVHSKDVKIERSQISAIDAYINDYAWK